MRLLILFALGLAAGLICLPLTASLRERILLAVAEFKRGYHWGETHNRASIGDEP